MDDQAGYEWIPLIFSKEVGAATVSILIAIAGLNLIRRTDKNSPLAPYVMPILGLTFILPVVLFTMVLKGSTEFVTGILGTIVGYIFGVSPGKISNAPETDKPAALENEPVPDPRR